MSFDFDRKDKIKRFLKGILCVPKCVSCGEHLPIDRLDDGENVLCDKCRAAWEKSKRTVCPKCGKNLSECVCTTDALAESCCSVLMSLVPYNHESAMCRHVVQSVLFRIKDYNDSELSSFLAKELCFRILGLAYEIGSENIFVTFAPRSAKAKASAGHDQSEILAKKLSKYLGAKFCHAIKRKNVFSGRTPQKMLSESERLANAQRSYAPTREIDKIKGRCIILVDDIATTGATLAACTGILKSAGAGSVICLTVAKSVFEAEQDEVEIIDPKQLSETEGQK